jgi:hypothetical protein
VAWVKVRPHLKNNQHEKRLGVVHVVDRCMRPGFNPLVLPKQKTQTNIYTGLLSLIPHPVRPRGRPGLQLGSALPPLGAGTHLGA